MNKTTEALKLAEAMAKRYGVRMCDENGDTHGEELYCVGVDDIADIIREALANHIPDATKMIDEPVFKFLLGEGELEGCGFGEKPEGERGNYWWRKHLRKALAEPVKQEPVAIDWDKIQEVLSNVWCRVISADDGLDAIQDLIYAAPVDAKAIRADERQRCIDAIRKAHDEELCDAYDCIKVIKELE